MVLPAASGRWSAGLCRVHASPSMASTPPRLSGRHRARRHRTHSRFAGPAARNRAAPGCSAAVRQRGRDQEQAAGSCEHGQGDPLLDRRLRRFTVAGRASVCVARTPDQSAQQLVDLWQDAGEDKSSVKMRGAGSSSNIAGRRRRVRRRWVSKRRCKGPGIEATGVHDRCDAFRHGGCLRHQSVLWSVCLLPVCRAAATVHVGVVPTAGSELVSVCCPGDDGRGGGRRAWHSASRYATRRW